MNTLRIRQALDSIDQCEKALAWLEQYGMQLNPRDRDCATVTVRLHSASACPGAKEAEAVISAFMRFSLQEAVTSAISNCRNTIELESEAIRSASAPAPGASDGEA